MKIRMTFTEPLLGTRAGNKELATEYQASRHPDGPQEDEIESIEEQLEKASTVFDKQEGEPFLWDYQFKGFFKEACAAMIDTETITKEELKKVRLTRYLYKGTIDKLIHVVPRKVFLSLPAGGKIGDCERPLRGQTMRGERICLARSEQLPAGTFCEIEVITLNANLDKYIEQWLSYGALYGMGAWRTGGNGRFGWEKIDAARGR